MHKLWKLVLYLSWLTGGSEAVDTESSELESVGTDPGLIDVGR